MSAGRKLKRRRTKHGVVPVQAIPPGAMVLTGAASRAWHDWLLDQLRVHADAIAEIAGDEKIPIVVINPNDAGKVGAAGAGWNGRDPVFAMDECHRVAMAVEARGTDDPFARWLTREDPDVLRVFVLVEGATLLLNCDSSGWWPEPGSTGVADDDAEGPVVDTKDASS